MKFRTWNRPPKPCAHDKLEATQDASHSDQSVKCTRCGRTLARVTYAEIMRAQYNPLRSALDERLALIPFEHPRRIRKRKKVNHTVFA